MYGTAFLKISFCEQTVSKPHGGHLRKAHSWSPVETSGTRALMCCGQGQHRSYRECKFVLQLEKLSRGQVRGAGDQGLRG